MSVKAIATIFATGVLLVGGYFLASTSGSPTGGPSSSDVERADPLTHSFMVRVAPPGEAIRENPLFVLSEGDRVSIRVESAQHGELMIHGYMAASVRITGNQPAIVTFDATRSGRYALHLHGDDGSHQEIAAMEIRP